MSRFALAVLVALVALSAPPRPALADGENAPARVPLDREPTLARAVAESLAARPELRSADARVRAERERVPLAMALPDPVLSLGIQNDGFGALQIGKMETSFASIGAAQTFPFPGKRALREETARLAVGEAGAALERARLGVEADARRAWLDLVVVRGRLALLGRLEGLWARSEGAARARYESGEAAQTDLLRAQLERTRLRQRRIGLEAEERARLAGLNRLRGRPAVEPYPAPASLDGVDDPAALALDAAVADAEARSPELAGARAAAGRSSREADLARKERLPDLTVSAGYMYRGSLDPMWSAGISLPIPVLSRRDRSAEERAVRAEAAGADAATAAELVRLRAVERHEALGAALATLDVFRGGLLVQSRATAESALSQYRAGRVPFAAVLEAVAGNVADEEGLLLARADAQRLSIAQAEVSVAPALPGAGGGGGPMPGTRAAAAGPARPAGGGTGAEPASSSSSSSMGGM